MRTDASRRARARRSGLGHESAIIASARPAPLSRRLHAGAKRARRILGRPCLRSHTLRARPAPPTPRDAPRSALGPVLAWESDALGSQAWPGSPSVLISLRFVDLPRGNARDPPITEGSQAPRKARLGGSSSERDFGRTREGWLPSARPFVVEIPFANDRCAGPGRDKSRRLGELHDSLNFWRSKE